MCTICVLFFVIAWSPYAVLCLWAAYGDPSDIDLIKSMLPALFAKASAMFNPVVYALTNKRFRSAFFCILTCKEQLTEFSEIPMKEGPVSKRQKSDTRDSA